MSILYSFAIILMGKRKLVALISLSSWCIMIVVWLFLAVPWLCLQFVIAVFLIILNYYFEWLTLSNALEKSMRIRSVCLPRFDLRARSSITARH